MFSPPLSFPLPLLPLSDWNLSVAQLPQIPVFSFGGEGTWFFPDIPRKFNTRACLVIKALLFFGVFPWE